MHDLFGAPLIQKTENLGVPYMGSKRKYADTLIGKMLDMQPRSKYFYDLFGGGGAMSFAALQKGMTVFYNEKSTNMVEFIRFIFDCIASPKSEYGIFPASFYEFVSRERFKELKDQNGVYAQFVKICYSFGNKQTSYLFNPELEKWKHVAHDVVVYRSIEAAGALSDYLGVGVALSDKNKLNNRRLDFASFVNKAGKRFDLQRLQQLEPKIQFTNLDYREVEITTPISETIIYCDPPYRGTTKYVTDFDYSEIDKWFAGLPYLAFMSEYNAPFERVYSIETRSTLGQKNNTKAVENLYVNHLSILA